MYKFIHNQSRIKSEIVLQYSCDSIFFEKNIGNLLNVIDYLNNINMVSEIVLFENFTGDQITFLIKKVGFQKRIDKVNGYNSFVMSDRLHFKALVKKNR